MPYLRGTAGAASHGSAFQDRRYRDRDSEVAPSASVPAVQRSRIGAVNHGTSRSASRRRKWICGDLADSAQKAVLVEEDIPQPKARQAEVLVRVYAAGVTPTELVWYPTSHTKNGDRRTGAVPSHEFSGEIAEIGGDVAELSIGQEVYGMNDGFADGALAEYCVTEPHGIAPKPRRLGHAEAASVPIGALTAWQGLFDRAKLRSGERVLVHGGAGAVGVFAIQFAHLRGAHVTATVSAHNVEFVKGLGADRVIDYKAAPFEDEVRDIDCRVRCRGRRYVAAVVGRSETGWTIGNHRGGQRSDA